MKCKKKSNNLGSFPIDKCKIYSFISRYYIILHLRLNVAFYQKLLSTVITLIPSDGCYYGIFQ